MLYSQTFLSFDLIFDLFDPFNPWLWPSIFDPWLLICDLWLLTSDSQLLTYDLTFGLWRFTSDPQILIFDFWLLASNPWSLTLNLWLVTLIYNPGLQHPISHLVFIISKIYNGSRDKYTFKKLQGSLNYKQ